MRRGPDFHRSLITWKLVGGSINDDQDNFVGGSEGIFITILKILNLNKDE